MLCVDNLEYYLRFQFQIKKWHFKSAYWQEIKPEGRTLFVLCGFRFAHLLASLGGFILHSISAVKCYQLKDRSKAFSGYLIIALDSL